MLLNTSDDKTSNDNNCNKFNHNTNHDNSPRHSRIQRPGSG